MEDNETRMGGSVNTRSMKRERVEQESPRQNDKETKVKKRKTDDSDMSELLDDGLDQFLMERAKRLEMQMNPLFRADLVFMPYKDSLCFIMMALSELPGMLNFEELHKGWFPHAFHTRENLSYRGPIPAKDYFKPHAMMTKKRKEFDAWYAAQMERNEQYDLWKELNK